MKMLNYSFVFCFLCCVFTAFAQEQQEFTDCTKSEQTQLTPPTSIDTVPSPPSTPPPLPEELNEFIDPKREMPRFICERCEQLELPRDREECSKKELLKIVYDNFNFGLVQASVTGTMVIRFVITTEGNIKDIEVVRSLHPTFDEEGIRVVTLLDKWVPGTMMDKPVEVMYNMPIKIKQN